jgi:hypothetical protein
MSSQFRRRNSLQQEFAAEQYPLVNYQGKPYYQQLEEFGGKNGIEDAERDLKGMEKLSVLGNRAWVSQPQRGVVAPRIISSSSLLQLLSYRLGLLEMRLKMPRQTPVGISRLGHERVLILTSGLRR